jgi:hypothetical protein
MLTTAGAVARTTGAKESWISCRVSGTTRSAETHGSAHDTSAEIIVGMMAARRPG